MKSSGFQSPTDRPGGDPWPCHLPTVALEEHFALWSSASVKWWQQSGPSLGWPRVPCDNAQREPSTAPGTPDAGAAATTTRL